MAGRLRVLALGGDGIGPEVTASALAALEVAAAAGGIVLEVSEDLLHGVAWDAYGTFCRDETVAAAQAADAVLVGAVGGPKWDGITVSGGPEMQDGLMRLRRALDTYVGLRPARVLDCLIERTPFRPEVVRGADVMVLREMCGGVYFGAPRGVTRDADGRRRGFDTTVYDEAEIARIAEAGFRLARARRGKLCSVDKANVMQSGVLWRAVVDEVGRAYPDVALTHLYADAAAYRLALAPRDFDVMLGDNLFGDILSDQAGAMVGGLGLLPSACLTAAPVPGVAARGIYEPVHGSAPDIAGQGIADPIGAILSVAMLLELTALRPDLARRLEAAVEATLASGLRTPDLGGAADTRAVTAGVLAAFART